MVSPGVDLQGSASPVKYVVKSCSESEFLYMVKLVAQEIRAKYPRAVLYVRLYVCVYVCCFGIVG